MKPMLFNTDMVRAILEERKMVTRRVVKQSALERFVIDDNGELIGSLYPNDKECIVYPSVDDCTYQPGDILYVRETWRVQSARRFDADARIEFKAGGNMARIQFPGRGSQNHSRREYDAFVARWADDRWHPSIHMPREAARLFLRVTDVRVERLQEISPEQIDAEGCKEWAYSAKTGELLPSGPSWFQIAWNNTIKPADRALYGWEANPWVWVIEFERCEKPKEAR